MKKTIFTLALVALTCVSMLRTRSLAAVVTDADAINNAEQISIEIPVTEAIAETEPIATESAMMSREEFLEGVTNTFNHDSWERIFDIYGYEEFMTRSKVPHYFQTMFTDKFATGTIRSAGCGITCLSMVVSYLYDETITPDMMLIYDKNPDNPAAAFERGIRAMGLNCEKYYGLIAYQDQVGEDGEIQLNKLDAALEEGRPVIALMGQSSLFTDYGHFILITEKTEDGLYKVNDPNLENYYNLYYKDEFLNGFTRKHITMGLRGIYIFDSKEMLESNPELYHPELLPNR